MFVVCYVGSWKWKLDKGFHWGYNDCLKKEAQSYKMQRPSHNQPHRTSKKIIARILGWRTERIIEDALGEDQFGFRRGRRTRDTIAMLRIIPERSSDMYRELLPSFINSQKISDRVKERKLVQILNRLGIDFRDRRLISKWYMDQSVKIKLDQKEKKCEDWKTS